MTYLISGYTYIKFDALKYLIDSNSDKVKSICVRWETFDLLRGSSDLSIYPYLRDKDIVLYRNPRLHIKAIIDDYRECFMGSANISNRALDISQAENYNHEIGTIVKNLSLNDRLYFSRIEQESILITDGIYEQLVQQLSEIEISDDSEIELFFDKPSKAFLISSLPMSKDINILHEIYASGIGNDNIEMNCAVHDLALYNIEVGLNWEDFRKELSISFFKHPFIAGFLQKLGERNELYFGEVKDWIHKNCTDVPLPRKWEITENIQILYRWIVDLGEGQYQVDVPSHSERISIS